MPRKKSPAGRSHPTYAEKRIAVRLDLPEAEHAAARDAACLIKQPSLAAFCRQAVADAVEKILKKNGR